MALRSQRAVLGQLDRMSRTAARRMRRLYRDETLGPLLAEIERAESAEEAMRTLNGRLLRRMALEPAAEALADATVQAGLIGRTTVLARQQGK